MKAIFEKAGIKSKIKETVEEKAGEVVRKTSKKIAERME